MARFGHSLPKDRLGGIGVPSWLPDWLSGQDVREIQGPVYIPPRGKAGGYRKELAADIARKAKDPFTQRDIYSAVQAGADVVPLMGEDVGIKETGEYWKKGDYINAAASGLGTVLGVAPIVGDVGGKLVKEGGKQLAKGLGASTLSAVKPTLEEFTMMAGRGQIRQAKTPQQDLTAILKGKVSATDFDIDAAHPFGRKYEEGRLTKQLEDAGLVVDDDKMGRVFAGRTQADVDALKNAKTAAEYGRIYGYSDDDIAAFYLKRRGGDPNLAYEEFVKEHLPNVEKTASAVVDPVAPKGLGGIKAYHGSPHSFEEFDISKIGTGEGAQAYGHGLYFAENEGVARSYKENISASQDPHANMNMAIERLIDPQTGYLKKRLTPEFLAEQLATNPNYRSISFIKDDPDALRDFHAIVQGHNADGTVTNEAIRAMRRLENNPNIPQKSKGHMYEVNIAADPAAFLDWDKPLSEQPHVQEAMPKLGFKPAPFPYSGWLGEKLIGDKDYPETLLRGLGEKGVGEQKLKEAGIPGIRYLDAGSRGQVQAVPGLERDLAAWEKRLAADPTNSYVKGEVEALRADLAKARAKEIGSRNYVVFDPKIISIVKKYGLAAAISAGLISEEMGRQMQAQGEI